MSLNTADIIDLGYFPVRQLPDGRWIGVHKMLYSYGLFVDIDEIGYACRYCYEDLTVLLADLVLWNGIGDPPGKWIVRKGKRGDFHNPRDDL
jgi:hypothetical protein